MTTFKPARRLIAAVAVMSMIGLAGCANTDVPGSPAAQQTDTSSAVPGPATDSAAPGETADSEEPGDTSMPAEPASGTGVDADGFVIPGEVVSLEIGQPVTYYSMPNLTLEDAQRVTINSFDYVDAVDIPDVEAAEKVGSGDGVLVLELTWESVLGDVQSNDGYIKAYPAGSDEHAHNVFYRDDDLDNGGVEAGQPETGTYTYVIDRGPTRIVIGDYLDVPVAELHIDTSK